LAQQLLSVLAIDDDLQIIEFVTDALSEEGLEILGQTDPMRGLDLVLRRHPALVLLDLNMPRLNGMELLEKILAVAPDTEVVLLTGNYSTESAVEAIKKGASDYLEKPIPLEKLRQRVRRILESIRQRKQEARLDAHIAKVSSFEGLIGRGSKMQDLFALILRIAPHFQNALITGETGTGKELIAHALHKLSPGAAGPFLAVNCSAIPETLIESQLFGHIKGSFSGATQNQPGLFESAQGGTVFLDEIGEMPLAAQARLLRVLQNREIQRVGSAVMHKVNARIVAATNRDLKTMVAAKQFREDLYYRLSVIELHIPPLRERREDLPLLERHFLELYCREYNKPARGFTRRAQMAMASYSWPGNVRELESAIARACMLGSGDSLDLSDLPGRVMEQGTLLPEEPADPLSLEEAARRHARRALHLLAGNKVKTAEALGISRSRLYSLLAEDESKSVDSDLADEQSKTFPVSVQ